MNGQGGSEFVETNDFVVASPDSRPRGNERSKGRKAVPLLRRVRLERSPEGLKPPNLPRRKWRGFFTLPLLPSSPSPLRGGSAVEGSRGGGQTCETIHHQGNAE
jgi:hypothetical protein